MLRKWVTLILSIYNFLRKNIWVVHVSHYHWAPSKIHDWLKTISTQTMVHQLGGLCDSAVHLMGQWPNPVTSFQVIVDNIRYQTKLKFKKNHKHGLSTF